MKKLLLFYKYDGVPKTIGIPCETIQYSNEYVVAFDDKNNIVSYARLAEGEYIIVMSSD